MFRNLITIFFVLLLFSPVSAEITGYWPGLGDNFISTTDVLDIINGPDESVVFATSNGLSVFCNGEWSIFHSKAKDRRGYLEGIPLNNYVKCAEYDSDGNLWLGFGDGIQIYDGYTVPVTLRYPQTTLVTYSVNDLQSLGEQMWIAAGDSGVYCYQNGEWKWFRPSAETGLTANRITDMAVDYSTGTLVLASAGQGQYILLNSDPLNPQFQKINDPILFKDMRDVCTDNNGGIFFFNKTDIVHYSLNDGSSHILNIKELSRYADTISDISSAYDGQILVGTNYGLYIWRNGITTESFSRKELVDSSIKKVFADSEGRFWFTNKYIAGYYYKSEFKPTISFETI